MKRNEEVIIKTESVTVRVLSLSVGESTPWHFHKEVTDNMFCLSGAIGVLLRNPHGEISLQPGQRCEAHALRVHRVTNMGSKEAKYLLVQGVGHYDFNTVSP